MNVSGIRRNIKNIAHNYTDAQVSAIIKLFFSICNIPFIHLKYLKIG